MDSLSTNINNSCNGILPWLEKNNTCPICRFKLPKNDNESNDNGSNDNELNDNEVTKIRELVESNYSVEGDLRRKISIDIL